ncbi:MAG: cupin domain-containing protein [Thermodesulfobacteriota bacterium]
MESLNLMEGIKFNDSHPIAQPIHVDKNGRLLQFALKPGQELKEHSSPSSPVYLLVLKGEGVFKDESGSEATAGPGSILIYDVNEKHSVKAGDQELVFVAILHGSPRKED